MIARKVRAVHIQPQRLLQETDTECGMKVRPPHPTPSSLIPSSPPSTSSPRPPTPLIPSSPPYPLTQARALEATGETLPPDLWAELVATRLQATDCINKVASLFGYSINFVVYLL